MGIYDRDYIRQPASSGSFGGIRLWSMNTWLIVINLIVFVLNNVITFTQYDSLGDAVSISHPIAEWGYFSINTAFYHLQLWRLLTFQFLHANLEHVGLNMLALFFFGPMIESYLSSRRYLIFYLLCGFAGPVMYVLLWATHLLIYSAGDPMVGASAGIFGVLIAASQVAPNTQVLVYGIFPVRLRVLAWVLVGVAAYTVLTSGHNAGGEAAHLGGAAAGYLLIKNPRLLNLAGFPSRSRMRYRP